MPIITVEIMKTKDEREIQKTTKEKKHYLENKILYVIELRKY